MKRVVLMGQAKWVRLLCRGLNRYCADSVACRGWEIDRPRDMLSLAGLRAALAADAITRIGFRPGARTPYGVGFDLAWSVLRCLNRRAAVYVYWIGSDVEHLLRDTRHGQGPRRLPRVWSRAVNLAGASHLAAELREAGIEASVVPFPGGLHEPPAEVAPLPEEFAVLAYVPDERSDFYGGPEILQAASALPEAHFRIIGGAGSWARGVPENVRFLGWRTDMDRLLAEATVVVRLVRHDSVGGTAIEALFHARHLVYNYDLAFSTKVPFGDAGALTEALGRLLAEHRRGRLHLNNEGRAWALREFDPQSRFRKLAAALSSWGQQP